MKSTLLIIPLFVFLLSACGPTQKITNSWINPEENPNTPYESIFVFVLSQSKEASFSIEDHLAGVIASRGQKYVISSSVFPPGVSISENFSREQMADAIKKTGADAVLVLAVLDVKTETYYHSGSAYSPMNYGMYGSYWGYYNYCSPMVYSPGYYSHDKTYYLETNFFDLEEDKLLWSIQSEAYNPTSIEEWFDAYSLDMLNELKTEGLIEGKPTVKHLH